LKRYLKKIKPIFERRPLAISFMKRILTLLFLFFSLYSFAQNWADSGATWYYGYNGIISQGYVEIEYMQDTLLLSHDARQLKLTKRGIDFMSGQFFEGVMAYEYTYSDSDHVFFLHDGQFEILYDFSAVVGDTLTHYLRGPFYISECDSIGKSIVSATGTEIINDEELRWYETEYLDGISGFSARIYEKMGALDFMFPTNYLCGIDEDFFGNLRCYEDDNFELYVNPEYEGDCDYVYEFPIPQYFSNDPKWCITQSISNNICGINSSFVHYINGEVTIDSLQYKKLYSRGLNEEFVTIPTEGYECNSSWFFDEIKGYVRQEGRKIYFRESINTVEEIIYDFTLSVGDTIPTSLVFPSWDDPYIISSIDSIYLYDNYYRRLFFESNFPIQNDTLHYYIEGIGHKYGFIDPYADFFEIYTYLHEYIKSDIPYFQFTGWGSCDFSISVNEQEGKEFEFEIYPNPVNDQLQLKIANSIQVQNIRIYSISGKVFMNLSPSKSIDVSGLPSGMYLLEVESMDGFKEFRRFVKE